MLLSHWQSSKRLLEKYPAVSCIDIPRHRISALIWTALQTSHSCPHIYSKKTFCHTHVQCLSKSARTCNQRNLIRIIPPFPDEICFVNIKYMFCSHFLEILISKPARFSFILILPYLLAFSLILLCRILICIFYSSISWRVDVHNLKNGHSFVK